ncbi:arylsulfatase [Algoriphagus lutimaris]|uniref:arylsulfatase n=1 Tax=Algoriphagus lutimaris TaxID=613197 RepID=UPI00196AEF67|nr:arylsulfatase [Algoriphagus lutimaris]MBN3521065.1 arylsulfatase [Algoriphagus lutimaris]
MNSSFLQKAGGGLVFILGIFSYIPISIAQEVIPFPQKKSGGTPGLTIQESIYSPNKEKSYLSKDAPNIIIILIDDVGPAQSSTFGGEINTPTMDKIAGQGITYNRFHTTAMCSPTRAALLTGRNHHMVGAGQIAELANDWDGYSGVQPKTSAMLPEVLKAYGYHTGAWGKWHNTPAQYTTAAGPFDYWPTGYGFEYFYGFLAGEASQYEPNMVRNTSIVHPNEPKNGKPYHLTEDIADDAIEWLQDHKAFSPDKPFFMYWAPGAVHGPHHVAKEWADKYKGKFDDGWDAYRERVFANAKAKGWIPQDAQLTPRPATLPAWDDIPESEKPFQRRLMEVFAGFVEHTDVQVGKVIDEVDRLGYGDNTLIFYIWGDNGASAEGQGGTISELLAQNGIPTTIDQHINTLNDLGGLDVLGSPKTDNMYHGGWAWAGSTPYQSTKLIAAHFGGTRNPMAIRWPKSIKPDSKPHTQFHHVNDIVPTIYDILNITPPKVVNGFPQDPIQGVSMLYSFDNGQAKGEKLTQYFEIMGSRGIYHDGWFASAKGPREPWVPGIPKGMFNEKGELIWNPNDDKWELFNLDEDWSQANDLSSQMPKKLREMQDLFLVEFGQNKGLPVGGGLFVPLVRPDLRVSTPYTEWTFAGNMTRMPEFAAPALGNKENIVTINAKFPANADGVIYSLGGFSAGLSLYMEKGILSYEYNLFEISRTHIKAKSKLSPGAKKIEVITKYVEKRPAGPLEVSIYVDGKEVAKGIVPVSAPLGFTANDCLDVGIDLGSPVSIDYYDKAPFKFNGTIDEMQVKYTDSK